MIASKITPIVWEAIYGLSQSLGTQLEFEIFFVLDEREVRLVTESVEEGMDIVHY